jgi:WS/DGAT/MGAT family acyltransferase
VKQLSGVDASFLYMETEATFGHITGLYLYERPAAGFDAVAAVRAKYGSLVGELDPLHSRLVEVPFGLDHPYWIADPDFDLDFHVRVLNLARPGRMDQLLEQVSRIVGRPMDRTRPLWEVYVIDGLQTGQWALLWKIHHAAIDGAAGQLVLSALHDVDPHAPPSSAGAPWDPEPVPTDADMVWRAIGNLMVNPYRAVQASARFARELAERAGPRWWDPFSLFAGGQPWPAGAGKPGAAPDAGASVSSAAAFAPATPWNKAITRNRHIAIAETSLENAKRLKNATGSTVNDVVMAICAGALREYLLAHDALPDRPLRAMVPVSIRTGDEADPWTNRVSAIFADLPTDCDDPRERIARCRGAMTAAKRQHEMVPAAALVDLNQFSSPVLAASASRLASQLRLADQFRPSANLVISNVPGPRQPLYLAGARLLHQFPISIVTDGQGLNITVQSYLDALDFGFTADRDLVPDIAYLAELHVAEIARLFEATGAEWAVPPEPAAATQKTAAKKTAAKKR